MSSQGKGKNQNCLEGYACPQCGQDERLWISVVTMMEMEDMGSGAHEDLEYDENSYAECRECGFGGKLKKFEIAEHLTSVEGGGVIDA